MITDGSKCLGRRVCELLSFTSNCQYEDSECRPMNNARAAVLNKAYSFMILSRNYVIIGGYKQLCYIEMTCRSGILVQVFVTENCVIIEGGKQLC